MKSIRIGNDIRIEWPIVLSGDVSKLQDLDLTVEVRPSAKIIDTHNYADEMPDKDNGKRPVFIKTETTVMMNGGITCRPDIGDGKEHCRPRPCPSHPHRPVPPAPVRLPYHIEDNTLIAMWTADRQFATGDYDIILYAHKNEGGQAVCDQYRFVRLVSHTAEADAPDDSGIEAVIAMQPVTLELSGLSAYEVAVIHGFKGTEEEWIESLKPDDAAAEDYREKFMDTGINDTMPSDLLTTVVGVTQGEDTVTIELDGVHRGSSDGYQPIESGEGEIGLPAATRDKAGVMTGADKQHLDNIQNVFRAGGKGGFVIPEPAINQDVDYVQVGFGFTVDSGDGLDDGIAYAKIPAATQTEAGVMSASDKTKLDNIVETEYVITASTEEIEALFN